MKNETHYFELVGNSFLKEHNLNANIHFKNVRRGFSSRKGYISIPLWALKYGKEYTIYYVIHEVIHQIIFRDYKTFGHSEEFKQLEQKLLNLFNIKILYNKAYAKSLIKNNIEVFNCKQFKK